MTFSVLLFASRKAGTSPASFKAYYENKHILLIKSLVGDLFPIHHTRRFIQRSATESGGNDNAAFPAVALVGTPEDFDYDVISELEFADEAAFQRLFAFIGQGEPAARLAADEENFLDRAKTKAVVLGDRTITTRN